MSDRISWYRYVALTRIGEYLVRGWGIADDMADCHHGAWSVLMIWRGKGEPR